MSGKMKPTPYGEMNDNGQQNAHVQVLTAEVRTLVVGSRQVTLSVYNQLDEVELADMEPFGRVRPRGTDDFVSLVGRRKSGNALVRSRIPASGEAISRAVGFSELDYNETQRKASDADTRAESYEVKGNVTLVFRDRSVRADDLAAELRAAAGRLRDSAEEMYDKYIADRAPYLDMLEEVEDLPLIVLAGLR